MSYSPTTRVRHDPYFRSTPLSQTISSRPIDAPPSGGGGRGSPTTIGATAFVGSIPSNSNNFCLKVQCSSVSVTTPSPARCGLVQSHATPSAARNSTTSTMYAGLPLSSEVTTPRLTALSEEPSYTYGRPYSGGDVGSVGGFGTNPNAERGASLYMYHADSFTASRPQSARYRVGATINTHSHTDQQTHASCTSLSPEGTPAGKHNPQSSVVFGAFSAGNTDGCPRSQSNSTPTPMLQLNNEAQYHGSTSSANNTSKVRHATYFQQQQRERTSNSSTYLSANGMVQPSLSINSNANLNASVHMAPPFFTEGRSPSLTFDSGLGLNLDRRRPNSGNTGFHAFRPFSSERPHSGSVSSIPIWEERQQHSASPASAREVGTVSMIPPTGSSQGSSFKRLGGAVNVRNAQRNNSSQRNNGSSPSPVGESEDDLQINASDFQHGTREGTPAKANPQSLTAKSGLNTGSFSNNKLARGVVAPFTNNQSQHCGRSSVPRGIVALGNENPTSPFSSNGGGSYIETPESLAKRVEQREKQIKIGKSTEGYQLYIRNVPIDHRKPNNPAHPITPRVEGYSAKRTFDKQVREWRRALHNWDSPSPSCGKLKEHNVTRRDASFDAALEAVSVFSKIIETTESSKTVAYFPEDVHDTSSTTAEMAEGDEVIGEGTLTFVSSQPCLVVGCDI